VSQGYPDMSKAFASHLCFAQIQAHKLADQSVPECGLQPTEFVYKLISCPTRFVGSLGCASAGSPTVSFSGQ
jgi:hypothetical protein